jgi:hypothetical protein
MIKWHRAEQKLMEINLKFENVKDNIFNNFKSNFFEKKLVMFIIPAVKNNLYEKAYLKSKVCITNSLKNILKYNIFFSYEFDQKSNFFQDGFCTS